MTTDLGFPNQIVSVPFWSSDQFPIFISLSDSHTEPSSQPVWLLRNSKWNAWNEEFHRILFVSDFDRIKDPTGANDVVKSVLLFASKKYFTPRNNTQVKKEKHRPWWNAFCSKVVAELRRAYNKWKALPSPANKKALNRAEARKKWILAKARDQSWDKLIVDLSRSKNTKRIWNFTNSLLGAKYSNFNAWMNIPMADNLSPSEKNVKTANNFVERFTAHALHSLVTHNPVETAHVSLIKDAINYTRNPLNEPIPLDELNVALKVPKWNTMSADSIYNQMPRHLNLPNRKFLLNLFNLLFNNRFCADDWKLKNILPLLK